MANNNNSNNLWFVLRVWRSLHLPHPTLLSLPFNPIFSISPFPFSPPLLSFSSPFLPILRTPFPPFPPFLSFRFLFLEVDPLNLARRSVNTVSSSSRVWAEPCSRNRIRCILLLKFNAYSAYSLLCRNQWTADSMQIYAFWGSTRSIFNFFNGGGTTRTATQT